MRLKEGLNNMPTNEWYTPKEIISPLGQFDLDPSTCDAALRLNNSAPYFYSKETNGITNPWFGRVWMNPPYGDGLLPPFMRRMAEHNNGIALIFNKTDTAWFHDLVFNSADSLYFLRKRVKFIDVNGNPGLQPRTGSILVAYGKNNTEYLRRYPLDGKFIQL